MRAEQRWWRTADGGLVEDGHLDAQTLAYAAGDEIAAADEAKTPGAQAAEAKARRPAANKARGRGEDK